MMEKLFLRGSESLALGAIDASLKFYAGYPITPQNDIPEFLSKELPKVGGKFVQAESEVAKINMLLGASACGIRVMTSSSSPGISLMQEGISYLAGSELPAVIVNVMRWGPGLGGIGASQGDYHQATKGGGHGDYFVPVFAPYSAQEMYDLIIKAFDVADEYRTPAMILVDVMISLMKEKVLRRYDKGIKVKEKKWAFGSKKEGDQKIIKSLYLKGNDLERHNWKLYEKYQKMCQKEVLYEAYLCDDAEIILIGFGMIARIGKSAVDLARERGIKAGLFRPISLIPFPERELENLSTKCENFLVVEMNTGQMVHDIKRVVGKDHNIGFYGKPSSYAPNPEELYLKIKEYLEK
ncbi:MAG: 3-methyl-2-oxobutanoate dehydrogenase subunit VorB [Proteobacteria bacterium]|nr:3-methyl-2-oxobutanoate dehydrogenase subunit VorB [Pseudomonadota bacterium]